jgi:hypothetical protein
MLTQIRRFIETRRRSHLAGCTACGRIVVRYVYATTHHGQTVPDDGRCDRCGPIMHIVEGVRVREIPLIDYDHDVVVTVGQMDDDVAAAVAR